MLASLKALLNRSRQPQDDERLAAQLKAYKYVAPELSLLERLVLNDFWSRLVELAPRWLAPNVLTLSGGVCVAAALALTLAHSPALDGASPPWVYCASAALLQLYQTLDGCDGKQARRTGSGSPLGELMDHGIDALAVGAIVAICTDSMAYGVLSPWPWAMLAGAQASFHASNLTTLLSGRMQVNTLDSTELQLAIAAMLLATAAAGPSWWRAPLPLALPVHDAGWQIDWRRGVPPCDVLVGCMVLGIIKNLIDWGRNLTAMVRDKPGGAAQNEAARQLLRQAAMLAANAAALGYCYESCAGQPDAALKLVALLLTSSFCFGDAMARLITQRITGQEMPMPPPGVLCLISFSAAARRGPSACAAVLALSVGLHLSFFASKARAIASALGIRIFAVRGAKRWYRLD